MLVRRASARWLFAVLGLLLLWGHLIQTPAGMSVGGEGFYG